MERLGQWLKSAREANGISIFEAEQKTKLRSKALVAIEEGDFASLPPRIYVKGMVRTYAGYLGLDEAHALRLLDEELGPEDGYRLHQVAGPINRTSIVTGRAVAILLVLVAASVLFVVLAQGYSNFVRSNVISSGMPPPPPLVAASDIRQTSSTPTPIVTPTSVLTPTPSATPTPLQNIVVETRIVARSWLQVTADDKAVFAGILTAGETRTWIATDKILIRTGNAGGVEVSFDGRNQGLMGSPGEVIETVWTKP